MFALLSSLTCSHTRTMVAGMPRAASTCSTTASVPLSRARTACQTTHVGKLSAVSGARLQPTRFRARALGLHQCQGSQQPACLLAHALRQGGRVGVLHNIRAEKPGSLAHMVVTPLQVHSQAFGRTAAAGWAAGSTCSWPSDQATFRHPPCLSKAGSSWNHITPRQQPDHLAGEAQPSAVDHEAVVVQRALLQGYQFEGAVQTQARLLSSLARPFKSGHACAALAG